MQTMSIDETAAVQAWNALEGHLGHLGTIKSPTAYRRAVKQLDALLDITRGKARHPLNSLLECVTERIAAYETREVQIPEGKPPEVLRLLMASNALTQHDLGAQLGGQSVVSAVLAGKRPINARQARALAQRFGVSPAAFIA
jgi:HTH-type transcriptional regulator / antitoxin HigA